MKLSVALAAVLGSLSLTPAAPAAAAPPQSDVLTIYSGGLDELLVDPKDRGLADVLRLLSDRALDLPAELDDDTIPGPQLSFLIEALMNPIFLRAGVDMEAAQMGGPPFSVQVDLLMDDLQQAEATAKRLDGLLGPMLPGEGELAPGQPSLVMHELDGVPLLHGPLRVGRRTAFTMAINKASEQAPELGDAGLPDGVEPAFAVRLDLAPMEPFIDMFADQAGAQADMIRGQLEIAGLAGPNAITVEAACGYGRDRIHSVVRVRNFGTLLEQMGAPPASSIRREDLRLVPASATLAHVSRFDLGAYLDLLRSTFAEMQGQGGMDQEEMPDPIDMIAMMTGIHLEADIVDHLGSVLGMYMSDETGGGGLLSTVGFIQVENEEGLRATLDRLTGMANQMGRENANGYVRFMRRDIGGRQITVLTFPGLPVPIEISMAIDSGYLYMALSVQGLLAAMDQGRHGESNLADNPRFGEMGGLDLDGMIQVTFLDTPRTMRSGYGIVSLGMASLTNLTRSPGDPDRGVFGSMPSYTDLAKNAKAYVEAVRVKDGDLVIHSQGDRSLLVNACGFIGSVGGSTGAVAVAAIAAGVVIPAVAKARQNAMHMKRGAQFRNLGMAIMIFAQEHEDRVPETVEELVRAQVIDWEGLAPAEPSPDAGPEIWLNGSLRRLGSVRQPNLQLLAYDRAMLLTESETVVALFCDGHVEMLNPHELRRLMRQPQHDGVDFDAEYRW